LENFTNIHLVLGSSNKELISILPNLKDQTVLFYLDAHWKEYWPLLDELEAISHTHRDNCVIIIDDVLTPGKTAPYDVYNGQALSYEYIKAKVEKIFSTHYVYYIVPRNRAMRTKMVITPKRLV